MALSEIVLPNLSTDPLWQILQDELSFLLSDLADDPKYRKRVDRIRALRGYLQVEQIYYVPHTRPWPT